MKKNNPIKIILIIIIFIFLCSYYISNSGYYEYELKQRTILTNEKIKEFESDLKSNKNIDIKTYLDPEESNYSNKITNLAYNLSNKLKLFNNEYILSFCFPVFPSCVITIKGLLKIIANTVP